VHVCVAVRVDHVRVLCACVHVHVFARLHMCVVVRMSGLGVSVAFCV